MPRSKAKGKGKCEPMAVDVPEPVELFNLADELREALTQKVLSFSGDYHHSALHLAAPNPCMAIAGLGPVGLPLTDDHAKRIIDYASLQTGPNYYTGPSLVEASRLSFLNPAWETYLTRTLRPELCKALDVPDSTCKMELDRLIICASGSIPLPHQVLQGSSDGFATVVILLPSVYAGGQATISHASRTTTVDFSAKSSYAAAVLAWYHEATIDFKPISSGHYVALCYHLVHRQPVPCLPDTTDAIVLLRDVMTEWKQRIDTNATEIRRMGYVLDNTYDLKDMKGGISRLQGADAHRVRVLHQLAGELGYTLGFAEMKNSDYGDRQLEHLTDLTGAPLLGLTKPLKLRSKNLVSPADRRPGPLYWHYGLDHPKKNDKKGVSTVLLLIDEKSLDDFRYEAGGLAAALQMLRERFQIPPTPDNMKWVGLMMQRAKDYRDFTEEIFVTLLDCAIDWQDLELWKQLTTCHKWKLFYVKAELLLRARKAFSFMNVYERLGVFVRDSTTYNCSMEEAVEVIIFIFDLLSEAADDEKEIVQSWCTGAVRRVLYRCMPETPKDAEMTLQILKLVGPGLFTKHFLPEMREKTDLFDFWIAFHKLLDQQRSTLLDELMLMPSDIVKLDNDAIDDSEAASSEGTTCADKRLDGLILASLSAAASTWSHIPSMDRDMLEELFYSREERAVDNPIPQKIERVCLLIEHCILYGAMDLCNSLFVKALDFSGNPFWYFSEFFIPLISRLRQISGRLYQDICTPPFSGFLRTVISKYLGQVLGKPGPLVDVGLRKLGCGASDCKHCPELDKFILSTKTEACLGFKDRGNYHIQVRLGDAIDLCSYSLDKEYGQHGMLKITKHDSVIQCSKWGYRLDGAKALLDAIGPESVIASIMGDRYGDAQDALLGRKKYACDERVKTQTRTIDSTPPPAPIPAPTEQPTRVLRRKRKRGET